MSAFLGPIHYWLYNKIKIQKELTNYIASLAQKNNWKEINKFDKAIFNQDERKLEEIIDEGNIHEWLQAKIHEEESLYASVVSSLIKNNYERIEFIKDTAYTFGRKNSVDSDSTPEDAYRKFNDFFVNGMPCDGINEVIDKDFNFISWKETEDVHKDYWIKENESPQIYYDIRNQVMKGMLEPSALVISFLPKNRYKIEVKTA